MDFWWISGGSGRHVVDCGGLWWITDGFLVDLVSGGLWWISSVFVDLGRIIVDLQCIFIGFIISFIHMIHLY